MVPFLTRNPDAVRSDDGAVRYSQMITHYSIPSLSHRHRLVTTRAELNLAVGGNAARCQNATDTGSCMHVLQVTHLVGYDRAATDPSQIYAPNERQSDLP
jgi:hypothetical protein